MPTGYTCDIPNGIDFKTFVLNCARVMRPCASLREEPFGGDRIPDHFTQDTYHLERVTELRKELYEFHAASQDELIALALESFKEREAFRLKQIEGQQKQKAAYEAMLGHVNAWVPPSPEHIELQRFMKDQIEQSIKFDCANIWHAADENVDDWIQERRNRLEQALKFHEVAYEEECFLAKKNTKWIQALRASL